MCFFFFEWLGRSVNKPLAWLTGLGRRWLPDLDQQAGAAAVGPAGKGARRVGRRIISNRVLFATTFFF
jgi:hypothetical protein